MSRENESQPGRNETSERRRAEGAYERLSCLLT